MFKNLGMSAPVYVTRKSADGFTMTYEMSLWMPIFAMLLIWLNVMIWGIVGLITAFKVVF